MHAKMLSHPYDLFGLDGYEELQNYSCDVQNPGWDLSTVLDYKE